MSPIRLFILAILFYILYRLVFGKKSITRKKDAQSTGTEPASLNDVLVEDPVCHTYIPKSSAEKLTVNGDDYYFCSNDCLQAYQKENQTKEPDE